MIPRTKANYTIPQLLRALFIRENDGKYKESLKSLLCQYTGTKNILLTPSGRGGLYFILKALRHKKVIVPAYTCKAVTEAALLANKQIIYVDSEDGGFNMSLLALEEVIDENSIVIATHQFGIPCRIEEINCLCKKYSAFLLEDTAASLGSKINGKLTGSLGQAAFYSFDTTKLINVPMKSGFVTIKDDNLYKEVKALYMKEIKQMGWQHKLILLTKGFILLLLENHFLYKLFHLVNFQIPNRFTADNEKINLKKDQFYTYDMANWQAYIANAQVEEIEKIIEKRQKMFNQYSEQLSCCRDFRLPPKDNNDEWVCIRFPIRVKVDKYLYYKVATRKGIDFAFSFTYLVSPPTHKNATKLAQEILNLPYYYKLTEAELKTVIKILKGVDNEYHANKN